MESKTAHIFEYLSTVSEIANTIDSESIYKFIGEIENLKLNNGRLFILGVGGSAANASHAVNDFRKIVNIESYAVTDNVSELTARINDESWEDSYKNWLIGSKLSEKDAAMILSVGGGTETTSQNLVRAMDYSKQQKAKILSIVSRDGGHAKKISDVCILIPVINDFAITPHAEEWQAILWHLVVSWFNVK